MDGMTLAIEKLKDNWEKKVNSRRVAWWQEQWEPQSHPKVPLKGKALVKLYTQLHSS